jgi:prepilin-type N-terminal cleavage/methylation domain-containing protein
MSRKGFTFIELLVSVTIVAVLLAIGMVSYSTVNRKSRDAKRKADMQSIRSALEICRSNTGIYPTTASFPTTSAPILCSDGASVMSTLPSDPNGSFYSYTRNSNTTYTLSCPTTGNVFETGGSCIYQNP